MITSPLAKLSVDNFAGTMVPVDDGTQVCNISRSLPVLCQSHQLLLLDICFLAVGNLVSYWRFGYGNKYNAFQTIADSKLLQITATDKVSAGALARGLYLLWIYSYGKGAVTSVTGLVNLTGTGSIDFSKFLV
jgi:hypothetical protein